MKCFWVGLSALVVAPLVDGQLILPFSGSDASSSLSSFQISKSGASGRANTLYISNSSNTSDVLLVNTVGRGRAGYFSITNSLNSEITLRADSIGSGTSIFGFMSGTGRAGFFRITNSANSSPALMAQTNGSGAALRALAGTGLAADFQGSVSVNGSITATNFIGSGAGLTSVPVSGVAGGDLTGNYPNPEIAPNAIDASHLAPDPFALAKVSGGAMKVSLTGAIGINTGNEPLTAGLNIAGGGVRGTKSTFMEQVFDLQNNPSGGTLGLYNSTFKLIVATGPDSSGAGTLGLTNYNNGQSVGLGFDQNGDGRLFAAIKHFRVRNPQDARTDIWYASLEGPEAGVYLRGTATLVRGTAFVEFPEHFRSVASGSNMTVHVTPNSADTFGLAVIEKSRDGFRVTELKGGRGSFAFDWRVEDVRSGYEDYRIIRPWEEGVPMDQREALSAARFSKAIRRQQPER